MDTAVPRFEYRGKNPTLIIQNSARTPSIAVGDNVSFLKHGQDVRQRRSCASDVHHNRQLDSVRRLTRELQRLHVIFAGQVAPETDLDTQNDVAVLLNSKNGELRVRIAKVKQFAPLIAERGARHAHDRKV